MKVDKVVKQYQALAQIPSLVDAYLGANGVVRSRWSQRNLEKGKTTKFFKDIFYSPPGKIVESLPVDISTELLSTVSKSGKFRAVLRETDNKQYLEIWQDQIVRTVDLTALDIHGSVYSDVEFSSLDWSPDEKRVLYVAERKPPKTEPYYKRKPPSDTNASGDEEKTKGEEYVFEQDWGEQLVGKKMPVLVQYDIEEDSIQIVNGIPKNICIAQPRYSPDGKYVVGVAYNPEYRKFGLIYCTNRESTVFRIDFEGNFVKIPFKGLSVKSPIFTPDGKSLVWLQRKAGGPHAAAMALVKANLPLTEETEPQIIVDIVKTSIELRTGNPFYGLYNSGFPKRPWASRNRLLVNTNQKYTVNSYVINVDTGDIIPLQFDNGSQNITDVYDDTVLAIQRNYLLSDQLVIGKIPENAATEAISWTALSSGKNIPGLENLMYKYLDLTTNSTDTVNTFNAIYLGPKTETEKTVPLIVWPHGGPHSAFANNFILEASLFLSFGFAVLFINYRGSIGCGQNSVEYLLGNIGTSDVADCITATDKTLEEFPWLNPEQLALVGGSHGGFLVTHLSGQYPEKYKVVVARNPVIDVASMSIISDIPDWCYVEAGKKYTQVDKIDNDILLKMREASPIMHAHKVKAPTLLQIGSKDLRVPPHQGTEYHLRLKANNVVTRMNLYDDNHPLGSVPNEMDNVLNTFFWISEHLGLE